jgi:hypothetical protein
MEPFDCITNLPRSVYSIDFSNTTSHLAIGCADGSIHLYTVSLDGVEDRGPPTERTFGSVDSGDEYTAEEFKG